MEFLIDYGQSQVKLRAEPSQFVGLKRAARPAAEANPSRLVACALESPEGFPPLRLALTPDDHVAIVADPGLAELELLLVPIVEHVCLAGVNPSRIKVVMPSSHDAADRLAGVMVERHDPTDRNRLAYVATTAAGRRVYLNRTVVEADQVIVLAEVRHDPRGGLTGGSTAIFPALSDAATQSELRHERNAKTADEAKEVSWLFGSPFFLSVIAGEGDGIHAIIGGPGESIAQARKAVKRFWIADAERSADLVLASITGRDGRQSMAELAAALTHAAAVTQPDGVIVLLTDAAPRLGTGLSGIGQMESAAAARKSLDPKQHEDFREATQWLRVVNRHRVLVLSQWEDEMVEDLFATPIRSGAEVQRLIDRAKEILVIADANRLYVHAAESDRGAL